jgi:hypothetical protein
LARKYALTKTPEITTATIARADAAAREIQGINRITGAIA